MKNINSIKIGAAILAGGNNNRYNGLNKALINVNGKTIFDRNIKTLRPLFDEIHIISNKPDEFSHSEIDVFEDIFRNIGPLGGIYTALFHSNCDLIFIFSCDMPYLSAEMIKKIINHFINNDYDILIPQILNKIEPLHAIYSKKILTNLENHIKSTDQYKIRLFFQKVYTSYILLENSEENQKAFLNINSPDDLCLIQNIQ